MRLRFRCCEITHMHFNGQTTYRVRFEPVFSDDRQDQNLVMWRDAPQGRLELNNLAEHSWLVGQEYYLDINELTEKGVA